MSLKGTAAGAGAADVIPKPKPQMTADIPATAAGAPAVR
jgi:formyltetrahydrofolate synthetase